MSTPTIAVLGASGMIGGAVASGLRQAGFAVVAVARRFPASQSAVFGDDAVTCPIADIDTQALAAFLAERSPDVVVNCIGILQDGPVRRTADLHREFTGRLLEAMVLQAKTPLLVHMSIPGRPEDDRTAFSRTKRDAERLIAGSQVPFVILRPGFVIAPSAYGGSALIRALAALPIGMPAAACHRPIAVTDIGDIVQTVAIVAERWHGGARQWSAVWDVMEREPSTLGDVIEAFRRRLGGPSVVARVPGWLVRFGARFGDLAGYLGWRPPVRTTALRELERGVEGDPGPWSLATGIEPAPLETAVRRVAATVQERWFARLYLAKALTIVSLSTFWVASGAIALTVAFGPATELLTSRGFTGRSALAITAASSLLDIGIGVAIAVRRTCRSGLLAGIVVALLYMAGAALIAPDLWIEPLGALVKTAPAIVLMIVALAMLDDR